MNILIFGTAFAVLSSTTPVATPRVSIAATAHRIAATIPPARSSSGDDWQSVARLKSASKIRVLMRDGTLHDGKVGGVEDQRLVVVTGSVDAKGIVPITLERGAIREIQVPRNGSVAGAVIGAALGGVAGAASAWSLAWTRCSGGCSARSIGVFGSLIGMPLAGGYLGWYLPDRNKWRTIYRAG